MGALRNMHVICKSIIVGLLIYRGRNGDSAAPQLITRVGPALTWMTLLLPPSAPPPTNEVIGRFVEEERDRRFATTPSNGGQKEATSECLWPASSEVGDEVGRKRSISLFQPQIGGCRSETDAIREREGIAPKSRPPPHKRGSCGHGCR